HYQAVVDRFPQSTTVPNALYQIGRGLYNEAKYDEALAQLEKALRKIHDTAFPPGPSTTERDTLGLLASTYIRLKRIDAAVTYYKLLIQRFPDRPNPERA